ncbi:unnamed protein product [Victoria cruziana]
MMKFSLLLNHSRLFGRPVLTRGVFLPEACCSLDLPILLLNAHTRALHFANKNENRKRNPKSGCFGRGFFVSGLHPAREFQMISFCHKQTSTPSIEEKASTSSYFFVRIQCSREFAVMITSIFTDAEVVDRCISLASSSIGMKEVPSFEVKKCEQRDWIKSFEETFLPVKITDSFWVIPQWRDPQDVHATNVILNPGLAFGTGEHPTTKLCLLLLNKVVAGGEHVLDYGTGSGILGISAIRLGASYSLGVDIDPQAILSASRNAALNDIGPDKLHLYLTSTLPPSSITGMHEKDENQNSYIVRCIQPNLTYDIVVANILLNPLLELAGKITSYAKSGGTVGISGFLVEQLPQIEECYSSFLDNMSITEMDGWACVRGTKKF